MQFKLARAGVKTFAGVIMSAAVLGGMSANAFAERLIKVATEPTFPPFEFVNTQTGEVSGFEMDLVRAVGKELGAKIEFQVLSFDAIIPAMLGHRRDGRRRLLHHRGAQEARPLLRHVLHFRPLTRHHEGQSRRRQEHEGP